jgi:hypothetical protein
MTVLAMHRLASLELEDDKLFAKVLRDNFARDLRALNEGLAELERRLADGQDLAKLNLGTRVTEKLFDLDNVTSGDAELMCAGANDCSCHGNGDAEASSQLPRRKQHPDGLMARSGVLRSPITGGDPIVYLVYSNIYTTIRDHRLISQKRATLTSTW